MNFSENSISTKNPQIINFYTEHPDINFDDSVISLIQMLKIAKELTQPHPKPNFFQNQKQDSQNDYNSLHKNILNIENGEKRDSELEIILNKNYPTSNISRNTTKNVFYDFMLIRENKQKLIISSKETNINIKNEEVELFLNSCKQLKCNGIFMSHESGIINKDNYEIDIVGRNIIVYVHFAKFDIEKINIAFDIIDNICNKLDYLNISNDETISKDLLKEINKEHQFFIKQKDDLKCYIKDNVNKFLNQLDDIKFNTLNKYLISKSFSNETVGLHKCNLCNFYTSNTLKGLAAHKRGCKKKVK